MQPMMRCPLLEVTTTSSISPIFSVLLHLLEARQDNPLVGGDKTDIVGFTVAVLHDRFTFPINQDGTDRMRYLVHQIFQNYFKMT